ncbi:MAG: peptidoglycan bridge formation glycyltransferase FemA/FemB family protein [Patescibacteria group bacterium]|jgi:lipid II:glycine glycyltransferase (peptidoglycan interpeptide bridge formation enzyme)|nr:peptidoglycan bridge formation glycyltransferase FemA/FemB family protein [Patescibacteria group bacterium]MDD5172545.1 peptidoglycan bridge formation glycyltransferase FemA/FemB family protein [Patescibacteria group bacterium]
MSIKRIFEKENWDNIIISKASKTGSEFLQSWQWGSFQKKIGRESYFLKIEDNNIVSQILLIQHNLPFNKCYLYLPRPVVFNQNHLEILVKNLREIIKNKKPIFIREDFKNKEIIKNFKKVDSVQPTKTIILNLEKPEDKIFSQMHHKTRYNIRLAQKHGVEIFSSNEKKDQEIFLNLLHQTAKRNKFRIYSDNYYLKLLNLDSSFSRLYLAKRQKKFLAAHLLIFFGKTVTYLHGASSRENKELMAPYLLHWESIKEAKRRNFQFYDFWGIDDKKWPGLTRFKTGFGGQIVAYSGAFDFPLSKIWYPIYRTSKLCRLS